jgi:MFS family permease
VLILAYVLAFIDRQILNLLVEPLKRDMHLSDVQISLLQGLSFALFLSIAGLPIGRLVDTKRRTRLLAIGVAAWSLMTAACGLARSFGPLLAARIGVGAGEATMTPSAYSLIGDLFGARRLGLAMGLYSMGPHLGSGLALILGGLVIRALPPALDLPLIGHVHGWQAVFLALGPIGVIIALWTATLREPLRQGVDARSPPSWREAAAYFRRNGWTLVLINLAVTFAAMASYSLSAWAPSLLARTYHMKLAAAGASLGWRAMLFGAAGALGAGLIGDVLRRRGWRFGRLAVLIAAAVCAAPLAAAMALAGSQALCLSLVGPLFLLVTVAIASGPATLQEVTPNRLRGLQHAWAVLAVNLIGLGLGPTLVALITDLDLHDEARLNVALALALPAMLALSAFMGTAALAPYGRSLATDEA